MKRLTAKDLDQDLLDLYDYYVHGKIIKRGHPASTGTRIDTT